MIEFVSGYALGFVSGMAFKNVGRVRSVVALGLSTAIAGLDLLHQAIAGEESKFKRMLDTLDQANADVHVQQQRKPERALRSIRAA